ncbi:MAG: 4Fe-4S dicluster domain-containing protein [Chloroflexi bacterium]|nr:4Fe-4S dicluster domain-containing protein [Chloroflexota bacterium]
MTAGVPAAVVPKRSFRREVEEMNGQKVSACFQCEKCTNGCPVTFAMDIPPHKLTRSVHLGLRDEALKSDTIWVCASCETCSTRCPNGIDIAHVMDTLRQLSRREGITPSQKNVPVFHDVFLASIKKYGRVFEPEVGVNFTLKSSGLSGLIKQAGMGMSMFAKGKLKPLPVLSPARGQVKKIFKKAGAK